MSASFFDGFRVILLLVSRDVNISVTSRFIGCWWGGGVLHSVLLLHAFDQFEGFGDVTGLVFARSGRVVFVGCHLHPSIII